MIIFKGLVTADTTYSVSNQPNCVLFDVHNDTPYNMGVSFGKNTGADNADYYTTPHSVLTGIGPQGNAPSINNVKWVGTIYIYTETPLGTGTTNLTTSPAFQISMIGYPAGYQPTGTTSLARMTATPNTVNTNTMSTSTNAISNLTNAPGTAIISVQPTDAGTQTWTADNSGNLTVKGDNAGTLTTLLQLIAGASPGVKLAAAAVLTEALGNMKVDGTLESVGAATLDSTLGVTGAATLHSTLAVVGSSSLDNGTILTSGAGTLTVGQSAKIQADVYLGNASSVYVPTLFIDGSNNVVLQSEGSDTNINMQDSTGAVIATFKDDISTAATVGGSGGLTVSKVWFNIGAIKDLNKGSFSASGTYNHGLSGTPIIVLLCPSLSGSTWTFSAYTFTSTQFSATINTAANTNWYAYR